MNRVLLSLCFVLSACGEVVPVDGATDAGDGDQIDGGADQPDGNPTEICAGPSIAIQDLETCFLRRQCEFMVRCLPGFPDIAFCEANAFDYFHSLADGTGAGGDDGPPSSLFFDIFQRAVTANVANFNGDRAFQCLQSLKDGSCKDDSSNADCEYILTGDTAVNNDCFDDFECVPGAYCDRDDETSCNSIGRCRLGLDLGADCSVDRCKYEYQCVNIDAGGANVATCEDGSLASKCNEDRDCNSNLYCSGGLCTADVASGSDCVSDNQCPGNEYCVNGGCADVSQPDAICSGYCTGNLYCDPDILKCTALPGPTQSCSNVPSTGFGRCAQADNFCGGPQTLCVPRIPAGAPCQGSAGGNCALGTFCDSELGAQTPQCTNPRGDNADCNAAKHCTSEFCQPAQTDPGQDSCRTYVACWE